MEGNTPVTLPLPVDVSRCLGHGDRKGEWCIHSNECARHLTISHLSEPWSEIDAPLYRACSNVEFICFMGVTK